MMNGEEKSGLAIVAGKPANKDGRPSAEPVEPRAGAKGSMVERGTRRTLGRASVSPGLDRVRQRARQKKGERFTALLHHVDGDLLRAAYGWLKKDAAAGVDGVTWQEYGEDLEPRLAALKDRIHRGAYRALPSRRVYIPKPDGRQRPLGIAALEDKIVQRAIVEVLNAIWEEDFLGFSYGFRPGRGQHDAPRVKPVGRRLTDALAAGITGRRVNFILDADIAGFFDTVSHDWLIRFVEHRIADRRIVRLIRKWLKAGVMEQGAVQPGTVGTPQGAVISPLLANIYLHFAYDLWAHQWRQRHARGTVIFVRGACPRAARSADPGADDIVAGFEHAADAERFLAAMRERMAAFGLALHPEKTRLIEFGRFAAANRRARGLGKPETFNFLGFTHICARNRRGGFLLKRVSRRDRMNAKLRAVKEALRHRMHEPIDEQGRWLGQIVRGAFAYHAVPSNYAALAAFRDHITDLWRRTLRRRSQKDRTTWTRIATLANRWLPKPRIVHPWPEFRFAVRHPRWEPDARIGHVRFCAGGVR